MRTKNSGRQCHWTRRDITGVAHQPAATALRKRASTSAIENTRLCRVACAGSKGITRLNVKANVAISSTNQCVLPWPGVFPYFHSAYPKSIPPAGHPSSRHCADDCSQQRPCHCCAYLKPFKPSNACQTKLKHVALQWADEVLVLSLGAPACSWRCRGHSPFPFADSIRGHSDATAGTRWDQGFSTPSRTCPGKTVLCSG